MGNNKLVLVSLFSAAAAFVDPVKRRSDEGGKAKVRGARFRAGALGKIALEGPPRRAEAVEPAAPAPKPAEVALPAPATPEQEDFDRRLRDGDFAGW